MTPPVRFLSLRDLVEMLRIVLLFALAAIAYGILHDLITAHICVEYFTIGHPRVISSESPVALALAWGVIATWWAGLLAGLLIAPCARLGRRPKLDSTDLLRGVAILMGVMALLAAAAFIVAYVLASTGNIRLVPRLADRIDEARHVRFLAVGGAHIASYAGGFLGSLVLAVMVVRRRIRMPHPG